MDKIETAIQVFLNEKKPLHYKRQLWPLVESYGYVSNRQEDGITPWSTLSSSMGIEIKVAGNNSRFAKYGRGVYGLNPKKYPTFGIHRNMEPL